MGCGAIAIALAANLSGARVTATDISPAALKLASENVSRHGVEDRVTLLEGDLLQDVSGPIDILVSNPPYIPSEHLAAIPREIRDHEPRVALDGGENGMVLIERLICQAKEKLRPGGAMFVEIGWDPWSTSPGPFLGALAGVRSFHLARPRRPRQSPNPSLAHRRCAARIRNT